jgi:hypothetical protein
MDLLEATEKINKTLYESIKNKDSMVTVLDKLSEIKCHGVVFPRIMLVEIISNYTDKIERTRNQTCKAVLITLNVNGVIY